MSLTTTAYASRKIIKYGGTGLIAFVILWTGTVAAIKAYIAAHPPYIQPTVKYGILKPVVFPEKQFAKKNFTFELPNDEMPKFGDQAKVYVIYRPESRFLALEQDKKTASEFGFSGEPKEVQSGVYFYQNNETNKTLTVNVVDGSFKLEYPYKTDQSLLNPESVPGNDEAISLAKSFLGKGGKYAADMDEGEKQVSYWKIEYDGLKPVSAPVDAHIARVDFYRKNLENDLAIVSAEPGKAAVSVLVSGVISDLKRIVGVDYKYAVIDRESFSTYPIKTVEQAVEEFKSGNYWPASDAPTADNVVIRKISLAYFEPVTLTNYMQPVYVFEGDGKFVAYVPAITDKYISGK